MIIKIFEQKVETYKDKVAVKVEAEALTYDGLNRRANRVAAQIRSFTGTGAGTAALLFRYGLDMITGLIAALKAGLIYVPLDRNYPEHRLVYMLEDAGADVIITDAANYSLAQRLAAKIDRSIPSISPIPIVVISGLSPFPGENVENVERTVSGEKTAYILYTSGSTGKPKGVAQNHENVLYYTRNWGQRFAITSSDRMTLLTAFTHDGFVQDFWSALHNGAALYPYDVKESLERTGLPEFLKREQITIWHSVHTLFRYFAGGLAPGEHFPALRQILLGGEPLRKHDVELFKRHFPGGAATLANVYGQTESSVVAIAVYTARDSFTVPLLGQPLDKTRILLVTEEGEIVEDVGNGEIVIACDHIALGYWRDPEKTNEKFTTDPDIGKLYWTGDLGHLRGDGQITVLGRKDFQVKVRGFRVELGEIETELLKHEALAEVVVVAREDGNKEPYLCCYYTSGASVAPAELREHLLRVLPDYMVPAVFVRLVELPLTSTGKIDRNALPDPAVGQEEPRYIAPANDTELRLAEIWAAELSAPLEKIGRDADFFAMGGHSLKAINLIANVHKQFQVKLELEDIFAFPVLSSLAQHIRTREESAFTAIAPAEEKEYYPLASAQKRLFILHRLEPGAIGYNLPGIMEWQGPLDRERLEHTVRQLIERHESFRTSFFMVNDEPVQKVHPATQIHFEVEYIAFEKARLDFIRYFDLSRPPLLRIGVSKLEEDKYLLLLDMHHIIVDGVSEQIFAQEFYALYRGEALPGLKLRYRDYAEWQSSDKRRLDLKKQEAYWVKQFAGDIPVLDLPTDFKRPLIQDYKGDKARFSLEPEETRRLKELAAGSVTLYMVVLTVVNVFLAKLSGQEDIVVGSPTAGRRHADLQGLVGMLVNTLAIRSNPAGHKTFSEFLKEIKTRALEAFENQDFQFEELVEKVSPHRDLSRNPLFDVVFALHNQADDKSEGEEVQDQRRFLTGVSYFDLTFHAFESADMLNFSWHYSTALFKRETILGFIVRFRTLIAQLLDKPGAPIAEIEIISQPEKERLLYEFNNTQADYPKYKTIHGIFAEQVERSPDRIALVGAGPRVCPALSTFPVGHVGPVRHVSLTYCQLNEQSGRLAGLLQEKGVLADSIVGIMMERSVEMIVGIFGILKSGGAYLPIDPDYPQERIDYMLKDSNAKIIVGNRHAPTYSEELNCQLSIVNCELLMAGRRAPFHHSSHSSHLAYVIYTSGSTGRPKGVMIEHKPVLNFITGFTHIIPFTAHERILSLTTISFDIFGLETLVPLVSGSIVVIGGREVQIDGLAAAAVMEKEHINLLQLTPSRLQLFLNEDNMKQCLGKLTYLLVGGEAFPEFLLAHIKPFISGKIFNMYGPTETTIYSTIKELSNEALNIGKPIANTQVYIVDKKMKLQPLGVVGELCIGGEGLARGYLNNPELTAKRFWGSLATGGIFYRTGDLARWLNDGNIEFLGRIDSQVKIRGFRIEPGEIEALLVKHDTVKETAVTVRQDNNGDNYLCAYIVTHEGKVFQPDQLGRYLAGMLPDYMIPSFLVQLEAIPLTASGKIDRKVLPEPGSNGQEGVFAAPGDELEKRLAEVWTGVLGIAPDKMGVTDNFFKTGGHSLKAAVLVSRIHKAFDIKVPLAELFKTPTIRGIAQYMRGAAEEQFAVMEKAAPAEYYPLSSAQKRLYVLQQMEENGTAYNISSVVPLGTGIDKEKLEQTIGRLMARHESLRTSFHMKEETPVQVIHEPGSVKLANVFAELFSKSDPPEAIFKESIRPFDLSRAPLFRVGLIEDESGAYILLLDIHHIICDGESCRVLAGDFIALYEGRELPALSIQYKDYAVWQGSQKIRETALRREAYWLAVLGDDIPVLNLPLDYPRPVVQSFAGGGARFEIGEKETAALKQLALDREVTLYMVLSALTFMWLSTLSGQDDIIIGTPTAGRRHADLENVIGMFVNTLVMRNRPIGDKEFGAFLQEVKDNTLAAFENQEYQFEDLVERAAVSRDAGRNPLFDVMFSMQTMDSPGPGQNPYEFESKIAKFDLTLDALDEGAKISFTLKYAARLFKPETALRFVEYLKGAVTGMLEDPGRKLFAIDILPVEERQQVLYTFNDTTVDYPANKTIHQLFEEQVEQTPDRMALVGVTLRGRPSLPVGPVGPVGHVGQVGQVSLTYRQLNEQSGRLAGWLTTKGVMPDSIVGIMMERSVEMIVAIMGILKSGGAYLPIDPEYPPERIDFMLKDSAAKILLTANDMIFNFHHSSHSSHLAYLLYTSGSTGSPKGVMIEHKAVLNFITGITRMIPFTVHERILSLTTICFDIFGLETLVPLVSGSVVVMGSREEQIDASAAAGVMVKERINLLQITPSRLQLFLNDDDAKQGLGNLSYLLVGGEAFPELLLENIKPLMRGRIFNMYGPTETTIWSTVKELSGGEALNIGKPIANTAIYILDGSHHLVPIGVLGELYIGGDGLARGYLNRPELTADRFINIHHSILYRSGDIARWLPDGNIEFLGRIDQQVKIRGFRIELGEIENRLMEHPGIKKVLVLEKKDHGGDKYLCAYIVPCSELLEMKEVRNYLEGKLPAYMIPAYFLRLDRIPLTANGKVDRQALPEPTGMDVETQVPPRNEWERKLAAIWGEVLGVTQIGTKIGIDDNFFRWGGHSLKAAVMIAKIHRTLDIKVPLGEVFRTPTIRGLAGYIHSAVKDKYAVIEPAEAKEYYILSPAQRRMYVMQQMDTGSTAYNMPVMLNVEGNFDKKQLETVFRKLIQRHENLRTSFILKDGEPVQIIHQDVTFAIEQFGGEEKQIIRNFIRPFDLSCAPLLRAGLLRTGENRYILMVDIHHIVSDEVSTHLLVGEFPALYEGNTLPPLTIQYKDYAEWQQKRANQGAIDREHFWLDMFAGELPVLELPLDFPRPAFQQFEGNTVNTILGGPELRMFEELAIKNGVTLYMMVLTVFNILLAKLSGREDIITGAPASGRNHNDLQSVTGMFVHTLALRNYPAGDKSFNRFLQEVKENVLTAFDNREYPFEELVDRLGIQREPGRNPLFDVMLTMENPDPPGAQISSFKISPYSAGLPVAKFDLSLLGYETAGCLNFSLTYGVSLFREETARRFLDYFRNIITTVVESPGITLAEIEIITDLEKRQILVEFNNTVVDYPKNKTIHGLFEEQVERTPDHIALVGGAIVETLRATSLPTTSTSLQIQMSYRQLNEQSDRLAGLLIEKGVVPDNIVGIMMERSVEMIIGIMGILKSGGAYLPINPEYPRERIDFMLKDSRAKILLTAADCVFTFHHSSFIIHHSSHSCHLAYIIYTSGSTGRPKGVLVEHRGVVNYIQWAAQYYLEGEEHDFALHTPLSFDLTVTSVFVPLISGNKVVIYGEEDGGAVMSRIIKEGRVQVIKATPTHLKLIREADMGHSNNRKLIIGGEELTVQAAAKVYAESGNKVEIYNEYGPTETVVGCTVYKYNPGKDKSVSVPIGAPIDNMQVYILNSHQHVQPVGIPGEIYIGGAGMARGYLNNPELTAKSFWGSLAAGGILYRTGDLARWLSDGNIEFLGRIDRQVKIRGFRIELGEIQARLLQHKKVRDAIVIVREDGSGERYLCAYIIGAEDICDEMKGFLSGKLPAYMIPSYFVRLEKVPLTPNGKIDRKALPEPGIRTGKTGAPPRDDTERKLAAIWAEVLAGGRRGTFPVAAIGIHDNFFDLGGNSLKVIKMISEIEKTFAVGIPVSQIFKTPYIKDISLYLTASRLKKDDANDELGVLLGMEEKPAKIFAFPPAIGYGISYNNLAGHLNNHTLYAFNYIDEDNIMEKYAAAILELQPSGPYVLLGYSAGGRLCLRCAAILESKGREVSQIILLDCYTRRKTVDPALLEKQDMEFNEGLKAGLVQLGLETMSTRVFSKMDKYRRYYENLIDIEPVKASIHLIQAQDKIGDKEYIGWEEFAAGSYHIHDGFGQHWEMLNPGIVEKNAAVINAILEKPVNIQIPDEIKAIHQKLSNYNLKFLEYALRTPECLKSSNPGALFDYGENVGFQSWPTFVGPQTCKDIADAAICVCNLIKSIPRRVFGNDVQKISDYYQSPPALVNAQLSAADDDLLAALIARGDFILSAEGFKCLEYNIASNVGGMELSYWSTPFTGNPIMQKFLTEYRLETSNEKLTGRYIEYLLNVSVGKFCCVENQVNTVIAGEAIISGNTSAGASLDRIYRQVLQERPGKPSGRLILCEYDKLKVVDDFLFYNDLKIDILVEQYSGVVPPDILKVFKRGRLCLLNGPITGLLSNKFNLAVLSEHEDSPLFSLEEREAIKKYIPWTRKVTPGYSTYKGERIKLADFIRNKREGLVLKPAVGYGGKDVYVGKNTPAAEWEGLLRTALNEQKWLVQEYVRSIPLLYQAGEDGCTLHDAVWGFVVMGSQYVGGFLRLVPQGHDRGVINISLGATVSVIFEVDE